MKKRAGRPEAFTLQTSRVTLSIVTVWFLFAALIVSGAAPLPAETDLDAFMRRVLARRDDNWKRLQQYILDEREQIELRSDSRRPLWGERRDYTWYIRDGFFVRSPVRFNGVEISEPERRKYEEQFLARTKARDERARLPTGAPAAPANGADDAQGVDGLLRQVREPQFISSAYFLRFKFEEGKYALVGREMLDGQEVLRVEYYPANLFSDRQGRRMARSHDRENPRDREIQRMMNKVALVTLWVTPGSQQIAKYTFDNIDFDFLPAQWLVRLDTMRASMTMGQAFQGVWLPRDLEFVAVVEMATGQLDFRYSIEYRDYRQPDVRSRFSVVPPK